MSDDTIIQAMNEKREKELFDFGYELDKAYDENYEECLSVIQDGFGKAVAEMIKEGGRVHHIPKQVILNEMVIPEIEAYL